MWIVGRKVVTAIQVDQASTELRKAVDVRVIMVGERVLEMLVRWPILKSNQICLLESDTYHSPSISKLDHPVSRCESVRRTP